VADRPGLLLLSLILVPVLLVLWRRYTKGYHDLESLSGSWLRIDYANVYLVKAFFSSLFFVLFILLSVAAAAGFRWGNQPVPDEREGNEIVFVMDLSNSMLAEDILPSRIKRSAILARELMQSAPGARFAVVGFKGMASLLMPVTEDITALDSLLNALHPEMITAPGTDIEAGLALGIDSFTDLFESHRILVLFTDGELLNGDPANIAPRIEEERISLIVVGVGGSAPALVPLEDGSYLTDTDGNELTTELRYDVLERLGRATTDVVLMADEPGIRDLLIEEAIGAGGSAKWGYNILTTDRYRLFLALALLCLTASYTVRLVRWRKMF
jgi:Ca-activated chloride channel family protein